MLKKLIEGLPIEIRGRTVTMGESKEYAFTFNREHVVRVGEDNNNPWVSRIGWRVILALMECEESKSAWEPGTVIVTPNRNHFRLNNPCYDGTWNSALMETGEEIVGYFGSSCKVHRLPHQFEVGDWAQHDNHASFRVIRTLTDVGELRLFGHDGQEWFAKYCHHVSPPKEPENPFTGPHWAKPSQRGWRALSDTYDRDRDLADFMLKVARRERDEEKRG
jgi:hypothetical protein